MIKVRKAHDMHGLPQNLYSRGLGLFKIKGNYCRSETVSSPVDVWAETWDIFPSFGAGMKQSSVWVYSGAYFLTLHPIVGESCHVQVKRVMIWYGAVWTCTWLYVHLHTGIAFIMNRVGVVYYWIVQLFYLLSAVVFRFFRRYCLTTIISVMVTVFSCSLMSPMSGRSLRSSKDVLICPDLRMLVRIDENFFNIQ